jgi:hypothetical protein
MHTFIIDYTDGCGMWYITLWFTDRWSGAGLLVTCPGSGILCPSSGAQDYTDGCGMWYITLWFTGRWSGAGL